MVETDLPSRSYFYFPKSLMFIKNIVTKCIENGEFNVNAFETPFFSFVSAQFTTNKKVGHVIKYKCRDKKKKERQ